MLKRGGVASGRTKLLAWSFDNGLYIGHIVFVEEHFYSLWRALREFQHLLGYLTDDLGRQVFNIGAGGLGNESALIRVILCKRVYRFSFNPYRRHDLIDFEFKRPSARALNL